MYRRTIMVQLYACIIYVEDSMHSQFLFLNIYLDSVSLVVIMALKAAWSGPINTADISH